MGNDTTSIIRGIEHRAIFSVDGRSCLLPPNADGGNGAISMVVAWQGLMSNTEKRILTPCLADFHGINTIDRGMVGNGDCFMPDGITIHHNFQGGKREDGVGCDPGLDAVGAMKFDHLALASYQQK